MKFNIFNIDWSTSPETVLRWLQANRIEHDPLLFRIRNSARGQFASVTVLPDFVRVMELLAKTKNKTMLGGRQLRIERDGAK